MPRIIYRLEVKHKSEYQLFSFFGFLRVKLSADKSCSSSNFRTTRHVLLWCKGNYGTNGMIYLNDDKKLNFFIYYENADL